MSGLLYRQDMDDVRRRLTVWWNGGDIGRPAMQVTAPRAEPLEHVAVMPTPPKAVCPHYTTVSLDYRVNLALRCCTSTHYLGEAVPNVAPDLAPNCLALYLGCRGVETPDSVWCEPCLADSGDARFELSPDNFYWDFCLRLTRELRRLGRGKWLLQFPDLIEGLDTLAAMRDTQKLLLDLIERPEWVHRCLRQITDRYFQCYDVLYDLMRDEVGGSIFWAWAPGRMAKFQCDFSAMISAAMFAEFMLPVLREMCGRVSYCMYHWDGPGAIRHHDHLLSIERLNVIQWTPGSGTEPPDAPRWWPLYHKTFDAGKKMYIPCGGLDSLKALKREFGPKLKGFLLAMHVDSPAAAQEALRAAEV